MTDEARRTVAEGEGNEKSGRLLRRGRVLQLVVTDSGESEDRRRQRAAGIRERQEALAKRDRAFGRHGQADRADLDDLFALRLVARCLEVDRDQDPVHGSPI